MRICFRFLLVIVVLTLSAAPAAAQGTSDEWKFVVYPLYVWAPIFGADLPSVPSVPDIPDGGGGGDGDGGSTSGGKIDSKLNGALMFGFVVEKGPWRAEADGMWAALRGERTVAPRLDIDLDFIYGHVVGLRRVYKGFYVSGGVRRLALSYQIKLADFPDFSRKPGLWDPLVGVAWRHVGQKLEVHATFEGGGFGVGADQDLVGTARVDWKPISHFRVAFGYGVIHLEITDTKFNRTFTAVQTLQGPMVGVGFDF